MPSGLNTLDVAGLKTAYTKAQRLQIPDILSPKFCDRLLETLSGLTWQIVLNDGDKHFDIHPAQIEGEGAPIFEKIKDGIYARAQSQFQYFYENHPVTDAITNNRDLPEAISELHTLFNAQEFRDILQDITGRSSDFCDMQATQYRAGHFLTTHDDGVAGKNRQLAYVLNLSQDWQADWGGTLDFFDNKGARIDRFVPRFNSLSLFTVPIEHEVTRIADTAKTPRQSFTGWFRQNG